MADIALTKTAQGFIPCRHVRRIDAPGARAARSAPVFRFDLAGAAAARQAQPPLTLVDLAACVAPSPAGWKPDPDLLLDFARRSGPLLGREEGPAVDEPVRFWSSAAYAALLAVRLQECANDRRPVATLRPMGQPKKLVIVPSGSAGDAAPISFYQVGIPAPLGYGERLGFPEIAARLSVQDGRHLYTFINTVSEADKEPMLVCTVAVLARELSYGAFAYLCDLMAYSPQDVRCAREYLHVPPSDAASPVSAGLLYQARPCAPADADEDRAALAALVQALIMAHIQRARVDIFRGSAVTGYLSFDSLLSWLWYRFAAMLGSASIGYCNTCGKPFSLVGHRGMDRLYCSRACKTEAKNERVRKEREKIRTAFQGGASVPEIARTVLSGTRADERRVRTELSRWVALKHELDESIAREGFAASPVLKRCASEGLDLQKLLTVQRAEQLRRWRSESRVP